MTTKTRQLGGTQPKRQEFDWQRRLDHPNTCNMNPFKAQAITLFIFITIFCGIDSIPRNILTIMCLQKHKLQGDNLNTPYLFKVWPQACSWSRVASLCYSSTDPTRGASKGGVPIVNSL
jgi:hypothetical protein